MRTEIISYSSLYLPRALSTRYNFNKCRLIGWESAKSQIYMSTVDIESNYDPQDWASKLRIVSINYSRVKGVPDSVSLIQWKNKSEWNHPNSKHYTNVQKAALLSPRIQIINQNNFLLFSTWYYKLFSTSLTIYEKVMINGCIGIYTRIDLTAKLL